MSSVQIRPPVPVYPDYLIPKQTSQDSEHRAATVLNGGNEHPEQQEPHDVTSKQKDWNKHNNARTYKSRQSRGYGKQWERIRKVALERDLYLCQHCEWPTPATEVDHIKPKAQGGTDDLSNLQSLCTDCHKEKTRRENQERSGVAPVGEDGWPAA